MRPAALDRRIRALLLAAALEAQLVLLLLAALPPAAASNPGDWVITGVQALTDTNYTANGSIIVEPGGILTVTNSTIEFALTCEGCYNITVHPGGQLFLDRSTVRASTDPVNLTHFNYNFFVEGRLEVHHSDISHLRGDVGLGGVVIDGGDALIEDSTVHHNRYYGLLLRSGSPVVRRTVFETNVVAISVLPGATPVLEDVAIHNSSSFGLKISQATPAVRNLTVTGSANFAVGAIGGTLDIEGCKIIGGLVGIDAVSGTTGVVRGCEILQVGTGLRAQDAPVALRNSTIFSAQIGVNATRSAVEVAGNHFSDVLVGVKTVGPLPGVFGGEAVDNEFSGSGTAFEVHLSTFFVQNNTYGPLVTSLRVFHEVTLAIVDKAALPVPQATVTITSADGVTAFTGKTDRDGKVTASLEQYRESADGTRVNLTPHAVEIVRAGVVTKTEVNASSDTTVTIELKDPEAASTPLGVPRDVLLLAGGVLLVFAVLLAIGARARSRSPTKARKEKEPAKLRSGPRGGR